MSQQSVQLRNNREVAERSESWDSETSKVFLGIVEKKVKRDQKWRKVMAFLMGMKWELKRIGGS